MKTSMVFFNLEKQGAQIKTLLIVIFSIGLTLSASAQKVGIHHYHHFRQPRVIVGVGAGYAPFYPYYSPFGGPWYAPPYAYNYYSPRPSRLDLQIQDIRIDYADQINSVKMDKSLTRKERKQRVKELKYERDKAIVQAKQDYYYNRSAR